MTKFKMENKRPNMDENIKRYNLITIMLIVLVFLSIIPSIISFTRPVTIYDPTCTNYFYVNAGKQPIEQVGLTGVLIVGAVGQDFGNFFNSHVIAGDYDCLQNGIYNLIAGLILPYGTRLNGQSMNKTVLQASANNIDLISIIHPGQAGISIEYGQISHFTFRTNGFTGINGVNLNQSLNEQATGWDVGFLNMLGSFNYLTIMDGNEMSVLHDTFCGYGNAPANACSGDISFKVNNGQSVIRNIQYAAPSGTGNKLHLMANQFGVYDSTFDGVVFECQRAGNNGGAIFNYCTSGAITFQNNFLANSVPNAITRFVSAYQEQVVILSLTLSSNIIWLGLTGTGGGGLFGTFQTSSGLNIYRLYINGNHFLQTSGNAYWGTKNGTSSAGLGMKEEHWINNQVDGTILPGDLWTTGLCSAYTMRPEPVGWAPENQPAVPAGIGIGNAVQQCEVPWPVTIYMPAGSGTHIIDYATNTDRTLTANPTSVILYPGDKIYFATAVPAAWDWYGNVW